MVSRRRIDVSKELFAKLASAAPSVIPSEGDRWVKRASEVDSTLLAKASVRPLRLSRQLGACHIQHESERYVVAVGLPDLEPTIDGLQPTELTPALFQLSVLTLNIEPSGTEAQIRDILQGASSADKSYEGHDLSEIADLFPYLVSFKVSGEEAFLDDIERVLGLLICWTEITLPLEITESIRLAYIDVFKNSSASYPIVLALQGLVSAFWQTQYIELYRTIEQLFPATAIKAFSDKIGYRGANRDLNQYAHQTLGWRPKEDGALEALVRSLPSKFIEEYRQALKIKSDVEDVQMQVSKVLYKLRNSIVHYRGPSEISKMSDSDWQKIVELTCKFSNHVYSKFARSYFQSDFA